MARFGFKLSQRGKFRGYLHHRWIFSIRDQKLLGFPKLGFVDFDPWFDTVADIGNNLEDLNFIWKDQIPIEIVNNDYLGPTSFHVIQYYRKYLINDDVDHKLNRIFDVKEPPK